MLAGLPWLAIAALFVAPQGVVRFAGTSLARSAGAFPERTALGQALLGVMLLGGITSLPAVGVATAVAHVVLVVGMVERGGRPVLRKGIDSRAAIAMDAAARALLGRLR